MAEAIHCPSCSTRYRLRPERLRPAYRRARCFSCGEVFPLGLAVPDLAPPPPAESPAATASFDLADVAAALEPAPVIASSLTLGDLESTDEDILEKTLSGLSTEPAPAAALAVPDAPSAPAPAPAAVQVPEVGEDTLTGTYSSAKDAISKLFAGMPDLPTASKAPKEPGAMDMEATLSALEATLGKTAAPVAPSHPDGDEPTSAGSLSDVLQATSTTTLRLSQEDLRTALAAAKPEPPAEARTEPPTEALRPSDLAVPLPEPPAPAAPAAEEAGAERLRLKIGEEIYPGLTMAQLTAWIEEGRVLEHHLVARQHSENWLEAHKVPGLRLVFDRLRREREGAPSFDASSIPEIAPKKSLFGGLFGKS
ncbi:zinc-ribbon domain-containing protein [Geothrix terrae]|uniref:zinc-ribbon domain-containing protein n=1 Tax=Geothrix terrae TaxID=2922720 RepID=UPI001FAD28EC